MPQAAAISGQDTRAKLLDAAGQLFAEKDFDAVTVREICTSAGANLAAINYHFGDKRKLYNEVVLSIVRFAEQAALSPREGSPKQQFREFISRYLRGILGAGKPAWVTRLLHRELANPTPALKHIVETVMMPTEKRLREIIGSITHRDPNEEIVRLCAHSVIGQCLHYKHASPIFAHLWPDLWKEPERIGILADHIATFSLGALSKVQRKKH